GAVCCGSSFGFQAGVLLSARDRKSTRLNSSHDQISYAVFCLKKKSRLQEAVPHQDRQYQPMPKTSGQFRRGTVHLPGSRKRLSTIFERWNSCFFLNDTATTEIYTLSLHDALPIQIVLLSAICVLLAAPAARAQDTFCPLL